VGRADQRWVMLAKDILFEIEGVLIGGCTT
jgi:hypothetical protein